MGKRINPATVGAFVLGAIGLIMGAVVVFGSGNLFRKTHEYVIYFAGDINGLRVGAPVKFKGVEIGQVKKIKLRLEQEVNRNNGQLRADVRIPVIIELDEDKIVSHGGSEINLDDPHTVPNLIREGMRAQLGSDSFVTGLMYVALDIQPNTPIQMVAPPGSPLQEIPAVPNTLEQAQAVAVRIFERLDKVDFAAVFTQMTGHARFDQANHHLAFAQGSHQQFREDAGAIRPRAGQHAAGPQHSEEPGAAAVAIIAEDFGFHGRRRETGQADAGHGADDYRAQLAHQLPGAADAAGRLRRRSLDQGVSGLPAT